MTIDRSDDDGSRRRRPSARAAARPASDDRGRGRPRSTRSAPISRRPAWRWAERSTSSANAWSPDTSSNQAKENVRDATIGRVEETAKGVSEMVMDTIKRNPIPAALAGAGLAMLWANRTQGTRRERGSYSTGYGYQSRPARCRRRRHRGHRVEGARRCLDRRRGSRRLVAEGPSTRPVGHRPAARRPRGRLEARQLHAGKPAGDGAIAVGAGAVVGSVLPETSQEREVLGDASRQVDVAVRDTRRTRPPTKAEETLDRAEEKVSSPA